jgi:hypothetical protein
MSPRKPKADTNYAAALAPFLEHDRSLQADMATTLAPDDKGHLPRRFANRSSIPLIPGIGVGCWSILLPENTAIAPLAVLKFHTKKKSSRPPYCCVERHWLGLRWRKNTLAILSLTVELRASLKNMGFIPLMMRNHYDPDLAKLERR